MRKQKDDAEYRAVRLKTYLYSNLGDYCYQSNKNLSKTLEGLIEGYLREQGWTISREGFAHETA